jgi:hypothetical protein
VPNKKEELIKKEMPSLSIQEGKCHISHLNIVFNHFSSANYNMEMGFAIESNSGNYMVSNSISGNFELKLHANTQDMADLVDLVEPLIREDLGIEATTDVEISLIKVYLKHIEQDIFMINMHYKAECSTVGCASQIHTNNIEYIPEVFTRVNKILKGTGFRFNLNIDADIESKADDGLSVIDSDRFDIMDL